MNAVAPIALFRMSFILQDSSATTTTTYLAKIIESELYVENTYLSVAEISEKIERDLSLEFTDLEIINAIKRSKNVVMDGNKKYALSPDKMSALANSKSIEQKLDGLIKRFICSRKQSNFDVSRFEELFIRFLYHCFNSNKDALLLIIRDEEKSAERSHFDASDEERDIINEFLAWDNEEKDKLIYQIISTCYAYCSLTVKKDALLSARVFCNKKFYLDANIIFRMAGINKSERQRSVASFVKNCRALGIQLLYTSSTYNELNRVIDNKCMWLKAIVRDGQPLDLSSWEHQEDDFYEIYRSWCHEPGNRCGDFDSFSTFLHRLVNEVLEGLELIQIPNYYFRKEQEFINSCSALASYKKRPHTKQSLETDINNLIHLIEMRKGEDTGSVFSTSTFMISADQSFISFSADHVGGVQIIVLPSVWLTIMLRFCGRTEDDYKAFVSFMSIRNNENTTWDIYNVLKKLNAYTCDDEIKKKVITEMQRHRDTYPVNDEDDYDNSIQKAFDAIREADQAEQKRALEEKTEELKADFSGLLKSKADSEAEAREKLEEKHKKEKEVAVEQAYKEGIDQERNRTVNMLAEQKIARCISRWKRVEVIRRICTCLFTIFAVALFLGWLYSIEPAEKIVEQVTPEKLKGNIDGSVNFYSVIIWAILAAVSGLLKKVIQKNYSQERCKEMLEKEKARLTRKIAENDETNAAA